jgi:hypothetical protein
MEFRWLTCDEPRTRAVESQTLSEVLALAQKLQAEGDGLVSEEQVVDMGRELGVRPEHVREALRLRRRAAQPARTVQTEPNLPPTDHNPIAAAAQVLLGVFALGLLPRAADALYRSQVGIGLFFFAAFIASLAAGWSSRYSRLAGIAGAAVVPILLLVAALYPYQPSLGRGAVFFSLLSLCPLCSATGRLGGRARRWAERFVERPRLSASRH